MVYPSEDGFYLCNYFFTQSLRQLTGPIWFLVLMVIQPSFDKQLMVDMIS